MGTLPRRLSLKVYQGPSALTGDEIMVVLTGLGQEASSNAKTGAMVQQYIMPVALTPHESAKAGLDRAVCGDCALRPLLARPAKRKACYVTRHWLTAMHGAATRLEVVGRDVWAPAVQRVGRPLRLGAWGDPAAAPFHVTGDLVESAPRGWTGYTHQWRDCDSRFQDGVRRNEGGRLPGPVAGVADVSRRRRRRAPRPGDPVPGVEGGRRADDVRALPAVSRGPLEAREERSHPATRLAHRGPVTRVSLSRHDAATAARRTPCSAPPSSRASWTMLPPSATSTRAAPSSVASAPSSTPASPAGGRRW